MVAAVVAGALATLIRYAVTRSVRAPWGVLLVNVVGSGIGGAALALTTGDARLVILGGLCGGLTTFSTFTVETIDLVQQGKWAVAGRSVAANLVLGAAAAAGAYLFFA